MNSEKFFTWCRAAVKKIKYRPDRDAVHKELYEHLEDRYESFRSRGWKHEEAIDKTIEAMGSAEELAVQLAKIHRPFWPYMLIFSRVLLIIALVITILPFGLFLSENIEQNPTFKDFYPAHEFDAYKDTFYQDADRTAQRLLYLEPGCTERIDDYIITITNAACWKIEYNTVTAAEEIMFLRMKVVNLNPWSELANNVGKFFWAEDSLGNYYYSGFEYAFWDESHIEGQCKRSGLFSYTLEMDLVNYISQDAEWIDLHYDRDGRDFALRIDLTGGEKT